MSNNCTPSMRNNFACQARQKSCNQLLPFQLYHSITRLLIWAHCN